MRFWLVLDNKSISPFAGELGTPGLFRIEMVETGFTGLNLAIFTDF